MIANGHQAIAREVQRNGLIATVIPRFNGAIQNNIKINKQSCFILVYLQKKLDNHDKNNIIKALQGTKIKRY